MKELIEFSLFLWWRSRFRKYQSFYKAKVIRDRRTGKTKGYGFVSIMDPNDFLKALKEMNNKYIGNRPVKLKASNWKVFLSLFRIENMTQAKTTLNRILGNKKKNELFIEF